GWHNYQDTHRKYVAAYIKKLGLRFSVIVGVLVNIIVGVLVNNVQHNRLAVKEELNVIHAENQHEEIGNALTSRERPYMSW
ncbi:MAG: hypothetical protein ACJAVV_003916, partial [Alphaproteobacteria bacterium]